MSLHGYCLLLTILRGVQSTHPVQSTEVTYCPQGHFRPHPTGPCAPCSGCPDNQIVRETCWQSRDTVCGTFTEFQLFHDNNTLKLIHDGEEGDNELDSEDVAKQQADGHMSWGTVTKAMIAVLVVTGALFLGFVGLTCYRCRRQTKDELITQVDKDSDFEKTEDKDNNYISSHQTTEVTDDVMVTPRPGPSRIEQFEIAVDDSNT